MLTEAQKKAAKMLFENNKVQDTAKAVGVHRCTVWRWTQTRDFRKEWTRLSRNYRRRLERSVGRIIEEKEKQMQQNLEEKLRKAGISDPEWVKNEWANAILDDCLWDGFSKRNKH